MLRVITTWIGRNMKESLDKKAYLDLFWDTFGEHYKFSIRKFPDRVECLYRGPDGLKCAAGLLIPDDVYYPGWEGQSVYANESNGVSGFFNEKYDDESVDFLSRAQTIHDTVARGCIESEEGFTDARMQDMRVQLQTLAKMFDVDWE